MALFPLFKLGVRGLVKTLDLNTGAGCEDGRGISTSHWLVKNLERGTG